MSSEQKKIKDFTDLLAWQESHKLLLMIYRLTKHLPKEELFALSSQMRRDSVSVTSNIAEGFGRKSAKDKKHFYNIAHTSIDEIRSQLYAARDLKYIDDKTFDEAQTQALNALRILIGLVRSIGD